MVKFMRKEWRRVLLAVVAGFLLIPTALPNLSATAASVSDLQKQKQQLEAKIQADEAAKKKNQEDQTRLEGQINSLDGQISGIESKINETERQTEETQHQINAKQAEIDAKETELTKQREEQAEILRVIYETASSTGLEVFVAAESISQVMVYHEYLDALQSRIADTISEIDQIKSEMEVAKTELEHKKSELADLEKQQRAYRSALAGQRGEKNRLLSSAETNESKLAAQIEAAKTAYADVNNELRKLEEAARRRAAQQAAGQVPRGVSNVGFQYPISYLYVSTYFGGNTPFQSFHTGLDLVNYSGTPIYASGDGVITGMYNVSYGYGRYVTIAHNERLSSLYGHMIQFGEGMAVGQTVSRGEVIGYVGSTGWSTGPHLHFEIREYGVPVNPRDYLP